MYIVVYNSCFKLLVIMEWTDNKTKLLIEEFEKHPCLYNCKLDSYHNQDLRAVSWQRVAEVCGSTGMIPASKVNPLILSKKLLSVRAGLIQNSVISPVTVDRYVQ